MKARKADVTCKQARSTQPGREWWKSIPYLTFWLILVFSGHFMTIGNVKVGRVFFLQSPIYEIKMRYIASLAIEIRGVIFILELKVEKKVR